jgi:hypothetical protein
METWIDFASSYFTFCTLSERSFGRFTLEAVCELRADSAEKGTRYCLGSGVMAGNVYAETRLAKVPAYTYQMVASDGWHKVFRDYGPAARAHDSIAANQKVFRSLELSIHDLPARRLDSIDDMIQATLSNESLNVCVTIDSPGLGKGELQAPSKHINVHPERRGFQVETGPVLIPRLWLGSEKCPIAPFPDMELAYLFFNRLDQCELLLWRPIRCAGGAMRFFHERRVLDARISCLVAPKSVFKQSVHQPQA